MPWAVASLYLVVNVALVMFKGKDILRQVNKVKAVVHAYPLTVTPVTVTFRLQ